MSAEIGSNESTYSGTGYTAEANLLRKEFD
jgi:hypothetical protein